MLRLLRAVTLSLGLAGALVTTAMAAPVTGGLVADPANPRGLKYYNGGPAFMASVGEPEGFLYLGTLNANGTRSGNQAAVINELKARGLNALFVIGLTDRRYGGDFPANGQGYGNPFEGGNVAGNIDPDILNQWLGWFQSLDSAGIVTYFCFLDDLIDVLPGKRLNWNLTASGNLHPQEQKYVSAVVAKLKTLKNLVWCVNESADKTYPTGIVPRWKKIAQQIRVLDTYQHPIAIGIVGSDPDKTPGAGVENYANDPNIDQILAQHYQPTSIDDMYAKMVALTNAAAGRYNVMLGQAWPVIHGDDGRRKNWATAMAGVQIFQAYLNPNHTNWQWDALITPDADLNQLGYIDNFFKGIPALNGLVPRNDLRLGDSKWVLAKPGSTSGSTWVAYTYAATGNLGLKSLPAGTYDLKWLDTIDGSTAVQSGVALAAGNRTFARPAGIQAECALVLTKR